MLFQSLQQTNLKEQSLMILRKKHRKLKRERLGRKMDKKIEVKEIEDVIEIIKNTLQGLKEDEEVYISVEVIKHGKNKVE